MAYFNWHIKVHFSRSQAITYAANVLIARKRNKIDRNCYNRPLIGESV